MTLKSAGLTAGTGHTASLWASHGTSTLAHLGPTSRSCSPELSVMTQSYIIRQDNDIYIQYFH